MVIDIFSFTHAYAYLIVGSGSTTSAIDTIGTSVLTGSGSSFGDTTSRTDSFTTSPVTETINKNMS